MEVRVHPQVKRYLDDSGEKERLKDGLRKLGEDPFISRSGSGIKRLKGEAHDLYRLRVGEHRFERFVEGGAVWVQRAFRRGKGYLVIL
jgi:mRNA-degrading endonuclease RelE of RelBE toxin-antitoxin system